MRHIPTPTVAVGEKKEGKSPMTIQDWFKSKVGVGQEVRVRLVGHDTVMGFVEQVEDDFVQLKVGGAGGKGAELNVPFSAIRVWEPVSPSPVS